MEAVSELMQAVVPSFEGGTEWRLRELESLTREIDVRRTSSDPPGPPTCEIYRREGVWNERVREENPFPDIKGVVPVVGEYKWMMDTEERSEWTC